MTDEEKQAALKYLFDHHVIKDDKLYEQLWEDRCIYGRYITETYQDETGAVRMRRVDPRQVCPAEMSAHR